MTNSEAPILPLDCEDPLEALALYLESAPCPYLQQIYLALKEKMIGRSHSTI